VLGCVRKIWCCVFKLWVCDWEMLHLCGTILDGCENGGGGWGWGGVGVGGQVQAWAVLEWRRGRRAEAEDLFRQAVRARPADGGVYQAHAVENLHQYQHYHKYCH
jgi:hypothetical protein